MPDSEAGPWACPKLSNYITVQSNQVLKISCQHIIKISNRLDSELVRRNVVLDLGLKCLWHQQKTVVGKEFIVSGVGDDHQIDIV